MTKRYYLCDIIGTGDEFDPYRPAVADAGVNWAWVAPDSVNGHPTGTWGMAIVATDKHAALRSNPQIDALPEFPLDGKMNAINTAASSALSAALSKRGIDVSWGGTAGYREVLQSIGRTNNPAFNIDDFDVSE